MIRCACAASALQVCARGERTASSRALALAHASGDPC